MAGKKNTDDDDLFGDDDSEESGSEVETEEFSEPLQDNEVIEIDAPSRKERRRSRHTEHVANEVETRLRSAFDARLGSIEQMLRQGNGNQQQREQANGGANPQMELIEKKLQDVYSKTDNLTIAWQSKLKDGYTAEEQAKFTKQARELQEEREELVAVRTAVKMGLTNRQQQDPIDVQREVIKQNYRARHNDVLEHPKADVMQKYAQGYFDMRMAEGTQGSQELQDEAMDAARAKFGLAPKYGRTAPPPSREAKARMGGTSSSGNGSGSGRKQVVVTKAMRDMAAVAFPHIKDERKRIEHYVSLNKSKGNYK